MTRSFSISRHARGLYGANGSEIRRILQRRGISARQGCTLLATYTEDHAPCNCALFTLAGIPVTPVEKRDVAGSHVYRCLVCQRAWSQAWLDKRHEELTRRKA